MTTKTNLSAESLKQLNEEFKNQLAQWGFYLITPNAVQNPIEQMKRIEGYLNFEKLFELYKQEHSPSEKEIKLIRTWVDMKNRGLTEQEKISTYKIAFNEAPGVWSYNIAARNGYQEFTQYLLEVLEIEGIKENNPLTQEMDEDDQMEALMDFMNKYPDCNFDYGMVIVENIYSKIMGRMKQFRELDWRPKLSSEEKETIENVLWELADTPEIPKQYFYTLDIKEEGSQIEKNIQENLFGWLENHCEGPIYPNKIISEYTQTIFFVYTKEPVDQELLLRWCENQF